MNQLITNINNVDLMAALKEESYSYQGNYNQSKASNLSEFTNKCEMNKKFNNKIFLDWNK